MRTAEVEPAGLGSRYRRVGSSGPRGGGRHQHLPTQLAGAADTVEAGDAVVPVSTGLLPGRGRSAMLRQTVARGSCRYEKSWLREAEGLKAGTASAVPWPVGIELRCSTPSPARAAARRSAAASHPGALDGEDLSKPRPQCAGYRPCGEHAAQLHGWSPRRAKRRPARVRATTDVRPAGAPGGGFACYLVPSVNAMKLHAEKGSGIIYSSRRYVLITARVTAANHLSATRIITGWAPPPSPSCNWTISRPPWSCPRGDPLRHG